MQAIGGATSGPVEAGSVDARGGLDKYGLIAELARGGMGVVYLAVVRGPAGFSKLLVLKELRHELLDDAAAVAMFLDEARLAARLNHPNIVQTLEVGSEGRRRFIAMEFLDGQPLQRLLHRAKKLGSPIPLEMRLRILLDVLAALEYAHSVTDFDGTHLQVVHRDVSPQNVLVTYEGQVKLVDFGIAKTADASQHTRAGVLKGKMRYMAPEQVTGERIDRRADIFGVGVMLWEAVAERRVWEDKPNGEILRSLVSGHLPRVRDVRPDADPELAAIVDRAMSAAPDARYPTASAMRDDIERYLVSRDVDPASTRGLAALASQLFAGDRRELQALIDARLRVPRQHGTGQPTSVSPVALAMAISVPGVDVELLEVEPLEEVVSSWHSSASKDGSDLIVATPPSAILAPLPLPADPARPRVSLIVGAAAALGAVVALALADAYWSPGRNRAAAFANVAASPSGSSGSTGNEPAMSHLKLRVVPSSAQLYIDDVAVSNPYVADRARETAMHRWRADAPGYAAKSSTLSFGADVDLEIALDRDPSVAAGSHGVILARPPSLPSPAPQASGEAAPAVDMAPARRKREIDKDNPYAP